MQVRNADSNYRFDLYIDIDNCSNSSDMESNVEECLLQLNILSGLDIASLLLSNSGCKLLRTSDVSVLLALGIVLQ